MIDTGHRVHIVARSAVHGSDFNYIHAGWMSSRIARHFKHCLYYQGQWYSNGQEDSKYGFWTQNQSKCPKSFCILKLIYCTKSTISLVDVTCDIIEEMGHLFKVGCD